VRRATGYRLGGLLAVLAWLSPASPAAQARPPELRCASGLSIDRAIARASGRFALPEALLRAVIAVESNFSATALSSQGAMGLMQIMPATWADLRLRYALGADPYDPCDNVQAGAAYLREMLDRYGDPGFLAAYNAGPGRYEAHLRGSRALPAETIAYVARVSARLGGSVALPAAPSPDRAAWRGGNLFVRGTDFAAGTEPGTADKLPSGASADDAERPSEQAFGALFVARTGVPK